jgi:hypothetical protein
LDSKKYFEHPWQQSPAEMLSFAIENLHDPIRNKDISNLISFLIFDVSIETLFKVYLMLPVEVTKVKVSYQKRCEAIKGGFSGLVKCIEECAGEILTDVNLAHIQHYHRIRNKLYHGSSATTIDSAEVRRYAELAVKLHIILIDVDLTEELNSGIESNIWDKERLAFSDLRKEVEICVEILAPDLLLPRFKKQVLAINEFEPFKALWKIFSLIEEYFPVHSEEYFSEDDIDLVSKHLKEACNTDISQYPSEKDIILQVKSGMNNWQFMQIRNLPFGKYKVNSLEVYDILRFDEIEKDNRLFNVYLKAICEIIDSEVAKGNYLKPINNLMSIAIDYYFFSGNAYFLGYYKLKNMVTSIMYLHDCIKEWRIKCLQV